MEDKKTKYEMDKDKRKKKACPPPVRQTKTSYQRMLKANPLIAYQEAGIDIDALFPISKTDNVNYKMSLPPGGLSELNKMKNGVVPKKCTFVRTQSLRLPKGDQHKKSVLPELAKQSSLISSKNPRNIKTNNTKVLQKSQSSSNIQPFSTKISATGSITADPTDKDSNTVAQRATQHSSRSLIKDNRKPISKPRRSISTGYVDMKQGKKFNPQVAFTRLSPSLESLSDINDISPIKEKFIFTTPMARRRSRSANGTTSVKSALISSTPSILREPHSHLAKQLSDWLVKRGKRLSEFKHLKCFGVHNKNYHVNATNEAFDEENKENIEVLNNKTSSYENMNIVQEDNLDKGQDTNLKVLIARDALKELNKIIEEGYPQDACMRWLELIREKYTELEDEPEYWECRAAIEKSSGNFGNAVECYKTAIVQGAEVVVIEESLDCLLKKFSLLQISPRPNEDVNAKLREKTNRDARNVFKSSIIQFAVETRKKKTSGEKIEAVKKLHITPVRRSTRLSRSHYVSTPGVELWNSLKELSAEKYEFKANKALVP